MPATSEKQQRAMGIALAAKRGEIKKSKLSPSIRKMMNSMSEEQLKEFASTKHADIKKSASFKLYSNQEIYNLLTKSASADESASANGNSRSPLFSSFRRYKSPGELWDRGNYLGSIGRFFSQLTSGVGDLSRQYLTGRTQADLDDMFDANILAPIAMNSNGQIPKEAQTFMQDMKRLISALNYADNNRVDPHATQNVQSAISTLYQNMLHTDFNKNPDLLKLINDTYSNFIKSAPAEFSRAFAENPKLFTDPFYTHDSYTGEGITISGNSPLVGAQKKMVEQTTELKDEEQAIHEIQQAIHAGKITAEQGLSQIRQIRYEGFKRNIDNFRNIAHTLTGEEKTKQLMALIAKLDKNSTSSQSISDDQRLALFNQIAEQGSRFNLPKVNEYIINRNFGDISTNPLYKSDINAARKAFLEYKKLDPSIKNFDAFYNKVYTKDGNVDYAAKNKIFTDLAKSGGMNNRMLAHYDDATGTFYYGPTTKALKSIPMSASLASSLKNLNNENRFEVYTQLREIGLNEPTARRLAAGKLWGGLTNINPVTGERLERPILQRSNQAFDKATEDIKTGEAYEKFLNTPTIKPQAFQQKAVNNQSKLTTNQRGQVNTNNQNQPPQKPAYQEAFDRYNNVINNYKKAPRPPLMY